MLDRSRVLLLGALLTGAVAIPAARCHADMVLTIDGKWAPLPQGTEQPGAEEGPSDDVLRSSEDTVVDATYETVKWKTVSKPAGQVVRIEASDSLNGAYREGLNNASSGFFKEAAENFLAAAGELKGSFGKQSALYLRHRAYADAGMVPEALDAGDELLKQFPKSFYFADVQILRAKVAASKNAQAAADDVTKILAAVSSAAGMNNRDLFRTEWTRIFLTLETQRKFDEAEKAYRDLVAKIEKTDLALGEMTRQRALVGIGNCLVAGKKEAEARTFFDKATDSRNPDVLAGAYLGLGNVALSEAKGLKDGGKLPEAKDKLIEAVTNYLRVTTKYKSDVDDSSPVLDALVNQAHVFVALFEMSGTKTPDCESADRAAKAYRELIEMPSIGSAKNGFIREYNQFFEKKKAACSVPAPGAKPADAPTKDK